ncbi:lipoprotein [Alicyclobacillus contaminans]|uniref:MetQ/NlpA family ABC transporter substrate-binding protein n=1 Tax=Alicyclobacillus contaminans TaxID=392016 RepID=UPI0004168C5D|nr:MetQ/NlpA family ABC transporter substrate-binding protein [Alicyclobacillus contaminans]GMA52210.1 lipoprotein [Alicyclobacillus contaminans]
MKITSYFKTVAAAVTSVVLLAGCGASADNNSSNATGASNGKPIVLKVGANPTPHAEILDYVKPKLAKEGIDLEVVVYQDYIQPNRALASGDLDANYFQHVPYLNDYNKKNGTDLVPTVSVHFEPLGLYAGRSKSLTNVKDGATVAVPNDTTNEARALLLLQDAGLIQLKDPNSLSETVQDIVQNPHHLKIQELEAGTIPRVLRDVDYAVINGNYAIDAGLKPSEALYSEKADSLAAKTYANCVVVRKGDENKPAIQALDKALTSPDVAAYIKSHFQGAVVPVFDAIQPTSSK